jgi:ABC-type transport system involved in cytochrome c biogenesis permease component
MPLRSTAVIVLALSVPLLVTACSTSQALSSGAPGAVMAIGAENEYASVISSAANTSASARS